MDIFSLPLKFRRCLLIIYASIKGSNINIPNGAFVQFRLEHYRTKYGTIAVKYDYAPFGARLNPPAGTGSTTIGGEYDQPYRFSTKPVDDETGLGYWIKRYYSYDLGRWISRDPIGERGGLNLYMYVNNRPSLAIDPIGERERWETSGREEMARNCWYEWKVWFEWECNSKWQLILFPVQSKDNLTLGDELLMNASFGVPGWQAEQSIKYEVIDRNRHCGNGFPGVITRRIVRIFVADKFDFTLSVGILKWSLPWKIRLRMEDQGSIETHHIEIKCCCKGGTSIKNIGSYTTYIDDGVSALID